jgi:hypothetical protein
MVMALPPNAVIHSTETTEGINKHAEDELAHGAAATDAGDEHADERRPGDPPGPVERRPVLAEVVVVAPERVGERRQVLGVGDEVGKEAGEDRARRACSRPMVTMRSPMRA